MSKPNIYSEYDCPLGKSTAKVHSKDVTGRYCKNNCSAYKTRCPKWGNKR